MKILIIQAASLDKVILSTPIIRTLHTQFEGDVSYLTKREFKDSLSGNPYLTNVQVIDQDHSNLKDLRFDVLIDLQNDRISRKIKISANQIFRFKNNRLKELVFLKLKINRLSNKHLVDQYFQLLASLSIKQDNLGLDYFIPHKDEVELGWLPDSHQRGYAVVCIEAPLKTMQLTKNKLIELCDRINKPIILIGSMDDQKLGDEITSFFQPGSEEEELQIEELNKKTIVFNACGKFSINQQASLIKRAAWVFTHQNGVMQIAAAFQKKIYTIWGSSTPFFGEYPYRTSFVIFENNKLSCRPCAKLGHKECPKGHFKCVNDLTFDFYLPD